MPNLKPVNPGIYQSGETPVTPEGGFGMDSVTSPTKPTGISLRAELKGEAMAGLQVFAKISLGMADSIWLILVDMILLVFVSVNLMKL